MKITKQRLKEIIREELNEVIDTGVHGKLNQVMGIIQNAYGDDPELTQQVVKELYRRYVINRGPPGPPEELMP